MLTYHQMNETPEQLYVLEQIYKEYRGLMFHVANSILHKKQDAEDIVQDAFVSIAKHIQEIKQPVSIKTKAYVIKITERKAIDLYRRKHRFQKIAFNEESVGVQPNLFKAHSFARCISLLPIRYRHILLLKYRYGYSNQEISKLMHISQANTIKMLQRAKAKLDLLCREEGLR